LVHSIDKLNQRDTFLNLPDPSCYFIRVIDSCNAIGKKSISHFFINLTVNINEEFVNTLDWTHYMGWDGIDHYNIYRRITDQSSHSELIAKVFGNVNTYRDTGLCNFEYEYYVQAVDLSHL